MKHFLNEAKKYTKEAIKKQNARASKPFNITSVSRVDISSIGFDVSKLTDKDMKNIAQELAERYMHTFWGDLESIMVDIYELKQHNM